VATVPVKIATDYGGPRAEEREIERACPGQQQQLALGFHNTTPRTTTYCVLPCTLGKAAQS